MPNPSDNRADRRIRTPMEDALAWVDTQGIDPQRVLWLMPRIEAAIEFKRTYSGRQGGGPCISPKVQTADRLSQPRAVLPWLHLHTELVGLLAQQPALAGALGGEPLWALAQEYLELAMRLVLLKSSQPLAWQDYLASNPFSAEEAAVVTHIAHAFEQELLDLLPKASHPAHALDCIVWFDDAEALPAFWLKVTYPDLPVHRVVLPTAEGPRPWHDVLESVQEGRVKACLCVAPDETTQAQQAAWQIMQWLQEDPDEDIAVAVLDRVAARRLIPVLAAQGVRVDDRTGWRLSTASVAGWLDALLKEHADTGQVLHILHPFTGEPLVGAQPWAKAGEHTLSQWAKAVLEMLAHRGLGQALESDEAGRIVLMGLAEMAQVPAQVRLDAGGFLSAWRYWAEQERFRPEDVQSPVRMVPLLSTRLRSFGRAVVLGCAQTHLKESPPGLLPPSVARELGFAGPNVQRVQKLSALHALLMGTPKVTLLHAANANGKAESLLPELQWLELLLAQAGLNWRVPMPACPLPVEPIDTAPLALQALAGGHSTPAALRVTALEDWVACPLRFGLRHAMPWPAQIESGMPSFERLRGIYVHRVLENTARHMKQIKTADLSAWQASLLQQSELVWRALPLEEQAVLHPFVAPFERLIPRIAGRLMARAMDGWQFEDAEVKVPGQLELPTLARRITLHGRVDRLDRRGQALCISDIKFKHPRLLRKLADEPLSAPQLPAYQAMLNEPDAQLSFLGIHKDEVEWVDFAPLPPELATQGFASWGDVLMTQLQLDLAQFFSGTVPWQARPGDACTHCDVLGICRPGAVDRPEPDSEEEQA
ncbi:MAG TPA: PD-(D/E)XK nuclease family protein [Limnobacter sp.]|nr:PD-(D/E)XK nuclease family protein [Limnobacter sp.]